MSAEGTDRDRLLDLLADEAVEGLGDEDALELAARLRRHPFEDREALARAAAAAHLAFGVEPVEVPPSLQVRLRGDAEKFLSTLPDHSREENAGPVAVRRWPAWTGWLAAALCLLGWLARERAFVTRPADAIPSAVERRRELMGRGAGFLRVNWSATQDPAARGAAGDLIWSPEAHEGYMRFEGLEPNDPSRSQYQLWIFDRTRDERHPVDGGVFDVRSSSEVVPIRAKLRVREPTLFAVTVEKPGGVVVSSRERIVLVAKVTP